MRAWAVIAVVGIIVAACGGAKQEAKSPQFSYPPSPQEPSDATAGGMRSPSPASAGGMRSPSSQQAPSADMEYEPESPQKSFGVLEAELSTALSSGAGCEQVCQALASMRRAAQRLCELSTSEDEELACVQARQRLRWVADMVRSRCGLCEGVPER